VNEKICCCCGRWPAHHHRDFRNSAGSVGCYRVGRRARTEPTHLTRDAWCTPRSPCVRPSTLGRTRSAVSPSLSSPLALIGKRTRPVQAEGLSRLIISRHGLNTPALACVRAVRNCSRGCETPKLQEGHLNACVACICPIVWVNSWRHFGHAIGHGSSLPYIASPEPSHGAATKNAKTVNPLNPSWSGIVAPLHNFRLLFPHLTQVIQLFKTWQ
jgi:hypothetical protein